jgi:shikimate dehydrogenase
MKKSINAQTRLIGLFGDPMEHSLSPLFMNRNLELLSFNYLYLAFRINSEHLENALSAVKLLGVRSINLTIPHKHTAIPLIGNIQKEAEIIGAVNCIVNDSGKLKGYNTDWEAFIQPLKEININFNAIKVLLIGCGGAARSVLYVLAKEGVKEVYLSNRTPKKADSFIQWARNKLNYNQIHYTTSPSLLPPHLLSSVELIVNTTPVRMFPYIEESSLPCDVSFKKGQVVYDLIYNPGETNLLASARRDGALCINGFDMLINKGLNSLGLRFSEKQNEITAIKRKVIEYTKKHAVL